MEMLSRTRFVAAYGVALFHARLREKDKTHEVWQAATVPGDFIQAEFMIKDSKKYSTTAARLYRGQATNFRMPGSGFAPVFVI